MARFHWHFWALVSQNMMPSFTFPLAVQVCQAKPEMNYLQNRTRHRRQVSKQFVAMSRWPQPNLHPHHHPHPLTSVCVVMQLLCRSLKREMLVVVCSFCSWKVSLSPCYCQISVLFYSSLGCYSTGTLVANTSWLVSNECLCNKVENELFPWAMIGTGF